jgi:hypothetical protein
LRSLTLLPPPFDDTVDPSLPSNLSGLLQPPIAIPTNTVSALALLIQINVASRRIDRPLDQWGTDPISINLDSRHVDFSLPVRSRGTLFRPAPPFEPSAGAAHRLTIDQLGSA